MNRPPSVQQPSWQQLVQWVIDPLAFLDACAQRYGDCFSVNFSIANCRRFTFLSDPRAIEQIFSLTATQAEVGRANQILRPTLGDHSVLLLDGDRHQRQRQLLMPPFHGERMRAYGDAIRQITHQVTAQWQTGQPIVARSFMQEISLQVIMQTVFGLDHGDRYTQLKQSLQAFLEVTATRVGFVVALFPFLQRDYGAWSPGARFNRLKQGIDELLYAEIRSRRQTDEGDRTDILHLLMQARDEAGQPMTDEELRDELMTLLLAGHETTATALSWALYWVHQLPEVKAQLLAELASLGREADANAIARLPYLSAICSETLRIYPITVITPPRILTVPMVVMGYEFEPNAMLAACIYQTHRREDLYPEPLKFKPERFLQRSFSPYEYLPFGGGNRRCIGAAFALYEMKLALATILTQFDLQLLEPRPVKTIRRGVTLAPQGGIRMKVVGRRSHPIDRVASLREPTCL